MYINQYVFRFFGGKMCTCNHPRDSCSDIPSATWVWLILDCRAWEIFGRFGLEVQRFEPGSNLHTGFRNFPNLHLNLRFGAGSIRVLSVREPDLGNTVDTRSGVDSSGQSTASQHNPTSMNNGLVLWMYLRDLSYWLKEGYALDNGFIAKWNLLIPVPFPLMIKASAQTTFFSQTQLVRWKLAPANVWVSDVIVAQWRLLHSTLDSPS